MELLERVKVRLPEVKLEDEPFVLEVTETIKDRLNLRLGTEELPREFNSIVVDAIVKIWRRKYYEGIESEKMSDITTKFAENVLDEYNQEIQSYLDNQEEVSTESIVEFL